MKRTIRFAQWLVVCTTPLAIFAFSSGPPIKRTGAAVDGGINCTACHRDGPPANQGGGRVTIRANAYTPGVKQNISVEVSDPVALRWGFQITARRVSDETKQAGTFTANANVRVRCDPDGRDAPCNGVLEFASHTRPATIGGQGGAKTFNIEWTPPGTDVGEIIFYAAGNAANNNNVNTGDHIYTTSVKIASAGCTLSGPATITAVPLGVVNAASFAQGISSNAIISIFGSGFARAEERVRAAAGDLVEGKVHTQLGCVAVEIDGKRAPVFYVQDSQINAQAPILSGTGPMSVRVIVNPGTPQERATPAVSVPANLVSPGLFTFNGTSIAALNASEDNRTLADPSVVAGGVPAEPGHIVVLFGTGFGFTDPVFQPGEFADQLATLSTQPKITIGGTTLSQADVLYAGLARDAPGFYQFNVRVPASAPEGNVPVVIEVGGLRTQPNITIPVKR